METNKPTTKSIEFDDLQPKFLSLRIGEEIESLKLKEIKKVTHKNNPNNLPGVDYKYILVSTNDEGLTVNSWVFWNELKKTIQRHKKMPKILSLKHPKESVYEIEVRE